MTVELIDAPAGKNRLADWQMAALRNWVSHNKPYIVCRTDSLPDVAFDANLELGFQVTVSNVRTAIIRDWEVGKPASQSKPWWKRLFGYFDVITSPDQEGE